MQLAALTLFEHSKIEIISPCGIIIEIFGYFD